MTDKERKALEELVAVADCAQEYCYDETKVAWGQRNGAAWANARAVLATAPAEPTTNKVRREWIRDLRAYASGSGGTRLMSGDCVELAMLLEVEAPAEPPKEVAALIERLRVIENKPREPDACTNLYPPDYIVECREGLREAIEALARLSAPDPIPMVLHCPACSKQHIDAPQPEKDWINPPHRSHECQFCGLVWRPADVPTTGVQATQTHGSRDAVPDKEK